MGNYITAEELRSIADGCDALQPLWELLTEGPLGGVLFETGFESPHISCGDGNGEDLGYISWGDAGPAFYANNSKD